MGRFLSQDTWGVNFANPVELNRYGYTANNPINGMDPSGLFAEYIYTNLNSSRNAKAVGTGVGTFAFVTTAKVAMVTMLVALPAITLVGLLFGVDIFMEELVKDKPDVKIKTLEQIMMETQWKVFLSLRQNPKPEPEPEPKPTVYPPPPILSTPQPTQGPTRRLYHGTSISNLESILSYIDLGAGRDQLDFGQGFYTTASLLHAKRRAMEIGGSNGAIIIFDVPMHELNQLNHQIYMSADKSWASFILKNRGFSGTYHSFDWVEGPVAASWNLNQGTVKPLPFPEYHQLSIHSESARILFQKSLTGIIPVE